ncbi:acyl-CoA dehydrogenase family protein [Nocardioides litoris]|uniref:acyl-CoA dehydrogenase family protein n=1 Tax=Nocardioides litoris TaxID=1926648 RepID=UPI00111D4A44|nr:acyl-CoA dehydrogenase family protein [Nocardioides litoris]
MSWSFETDPEFQKELDWVAEFVAEEVEPLDHVVWHAWDVDHPVRKALIPPLQQVVKDRGLWAAHLGPEVGGKGYGQVKLALLNEILGRSHCGPIVFGCQAPDSGNGEILARFGNEELKKRYLDPLTDGDIVSAFSMTEPQGGSDPLQFVTQAALDGDEWVVNGEKWFSSHARFASFLIVLAVTDPSAPPHQRMSMFVVPADTPGVEIVRHVGLYGHPDNEGTHAYVRYTDVRIPADHLLGDRGAGFAVAQSRLGGGRIHHAMRTISLVRQALDLMAERAVSRRTKGEDLSRKQLVQEMVADSWIELEQFRLLVLQTAWKIDRYDDYAMVRRDISAVKAAMPKVLHDVASRALQVHGSLGVSNEMPFSSMVLESFHMGLADGPTQIHKVAVARSVLSEYEPQEGVFPSQHLPTRRAAAMRRYSDVIDAAGGWLGPSDEMTETAPRA